MFPRLFQIGSFSLPTYGALVAIAFLVGLWLTSRFAKERGVSSEKVVNLGVYCALTGMLGAKLLMIAMDPEYRLHPEEIFTRETLQSAGIFYGGFIAALVFAYFYMRRQKLPVLSDGGFVCAGSGDRARDRQAGLFRGGMLLGQADEPALGRDVHQQGCDDWCAAGCAAPSHAVLRGIRRGDYLSGPDLAAEARAYRGQRDRTVFAALRAGAIFGRVSARA